MKTALTRSAGFLPALLILGASAAAAGLPGGLFPSSALGALVWLLDAAGGACLLLRKGIDLDDKARDLAARLCLEQKARATLEASLADTQAVLARVMRQQEGVRDAERSRVARDIDQDLGQTLYALRAEMALLQVASCGIHPSTHQKTSAMIVTLDLALRSLRTLVAELRPLAPGQELGRAVAQQLAEFTGSNGIAHRLDYDPADIAVAPGYGLDALLYRVLQETLSHIARAASATEVRVRLARGADRLTLCIEDDGCADAGAARLHASLRERLHTAGGALQVETRHDGGSRIAIALPHMHGLLAG